MYLSRFVGWRKSMCVLLVCGINIYGFLLFQKQPLRLFIGYHVFFCALCNV